MSDFTYTRLALEYILDHEREDFEEQCEERDLTFEAGLCELDSHVYYCAHRGMVELDKAEEKEAINEKR